MTPDTNNRDEHEIEHFTRLDHVWWGLKTFAGQRRYDNKFERFRKMCHTDQAKILEVGCGNGVFTKRLAKLPKDTKIVATDITPGLIDQAKKEINQKNVTCRVSSLHQLPFKDNSFDIVCGISILHHVDLTKALSEIYRVVNFKGEIFFTEPNMLNPVNFLGLHLPNLREKMEFSPDETAFTRWFLEKQLKKSGFKSINVLNYDFLYPKTPQPLISFAESAGSLLEKTPVLKEFSGSLIIYAKK